MRVFLTIVTLTVLLPFTATAVSAQDAPMAELQTQNVHTNFMESFVATVRNPGTDDIVVNKVSVTIDWPGWAPTLYPIFDGHKTISSGEELTFTGPATRMPQTDVGDYSAVLSIVIETTQGVQEIQYEATVNISDWSVEPGGIPEYIAMPIGLTAIMLSITFLFFRLEKKKGWPPFRAVPRFQRYRRT